MEMDKKENFAGGRKLQLENVQEFFTSKIQEEDAMKTVKLKGEKSH